MSTRETYLIDTPWIIMQWLMTDAEADRNGGRSKLNFICCICGKQEEKHFAVPADNDPVWETIDPKEGLPECKRLREDFQLAHLHPDKHQDPMKEWEYPLLNPAALKGGIDIHALCDRLQADLLKRDEGDRHE